MTDGSEFTVSQFDTDAENHLAKARLRQLEWLATQGVEAYPADFPERTHTSQEILDDSGTLDGSGVVIAGRIIESRVHKRAIFFDIGDEDGIIQTVVDAETTAPDHFELIKTAFGRGDIITVQGIVGTTRRGTVAIQSREVTMLSKSLQPPPEQLTDPDARFEKRHVDMLVNANSRERLIARSKITQHIRQVLLGSGLIEVETPIANTYYNGGVAKPFVAHHNALGEQVYLRVTSELYLKRLIIGGLEGVFEIAKQFRNEGMSSVYSPEFTVLEMYKAYKDHRWMMDVVERIISGAAEGIHQSSELQWREHSIDLAPPWPRLNMREAVARSIRRDSALSDDELVEIGVREDMGSSPHVVLQNLFRRYTEPGLINPTFIVDFPVALSPLAKVDARAEGVAQKFMCYVGGTLISDGNYEENNPIRQRANLKAQKEEQHEAGLPEYPRDPEFIDALQYGMPPLAGAAIGIDRLTMLITNASHIREVMAFRPRRLAKQ